MHRSGLPRKRRMTGSEATVHSGFLRATRRDAIILWTDGPPKARRGNLRRSWPVACISGNLPNSLKTKDSTDDTRRCERGRNREKDPRIGVFEFRLKFWKDI